ncbi:hypothetical protein ES703_113985 [subsurface metagenome]
MRLYKVENWVYELANSLLPPRDPTPEEKIPPETEFAKLFSTEMVDWLIRLGFTRDQAVALYNGLFTHYWYTVGVHNVLRVQIQIRDYIAARVAPPIYKARGIAPEGLPPQVIWFAIVMGVILVAVLLVAPEFYKTYKWTPPCDSYIATFEESLWWMTLVHRDSDGRLWYKDVGHAGGVIAVHTYEHIAPPVVTDRFHFWGGMEFRCWQIPWFRVYRAQHVDTTFVGFLENMGRGFYMLRPQYDDPFAPPGPFVISPADYCTAWSPCQA